jgi:hypothetical protein
MTACNDACTADAAMADGLPLDPFQALRVTFGMQLGVDDFETIVGYARGKHLLHQAWLHGSGVVWGYPVHDAGTQVRVGPGLAVDAYGRDLLLQTEQCRDAAAWYADRASSADPPEIERTERQRIVRACLMVTFATRTAGPVPVPAQVGDLSHSQVADSRTVETARLELVAGACPPRRPGPFRRLRVLVGLDAPGDDKPAREAVEAREWVARQPPSERLAAAAKAFRRLAAKDVAEAEPTGGGYCGIGPLPVPAEHSGVVLARVALHLDDDGRGTGTAVRAVHVDPERRSSLLPTWLLQELLAARVPAPPYRVEPVDDDAPRLVADPVAWADDGESFTFRFTRRVHPRTVTERTVIVTGLGVGGWERLAVADVDYDGEHAVTVRLASAPPYRIVRLLVVGTGPAPVAGLNGEPLAGRQGDPPAAGGGRDAVLTIGRQ